jgi:hypothetical protein
VVKAGIVAVWLIGLIYSATYLKSQIDGLETSFAHYLMEVMPRELLACFLILLCVGYARYSDFEVIRKGAKAELGTNVRWFAIISVVTSIVFSIEFLFIEVTAMHELLSTHLLYLTVLLWLQIFMGFVAIGLLQVLLVNLGISWAHSLPVIFSFYMLAFWMFWGVLPDSWIAHIYYFSYPTTLTFSKVVVTKILPFIGYVVVMGAANYWAFSRKDRLGGPVRA